MKGAAICIVTMSTVFLSLCPHKNGVIVNGNRNGSASKGEEFGLLLCVWEAKPNSKPQDELIPFEGEEYKIVLDTEGSDCTSQPDPEVIVSSKAHHFIKWPKECKITPSHGKIGIYVNPGRCYNSVKINLFPKIIEGDENSAKEACKRRIQYGSKRRYDYIVTCWRDKKEE